MTQEISAEQQAHINQKYEELWAATTELYQKAVARREASDVFDKKKEEFLTALAEARNASPDEIYNMLLLF